MATVTTDRISLPARRQTTGVWVDVGTYEASALPANDVIQAVNIPEGAVVLYGFVIHDALGASVTLDVGDGADVDRFIDGADGNTAGVKLFNAVTAFPRRYSSADTLDVTVLGAAATGTITVVVFFTKEQLDLS